MFLIIARPELLADPDFVLEAVKRKRRHRWNRNPRPQADIFQSAGVSNRLWLLYICLNWLSLLGDRGFRFHWLRRALEYVAESLRTDRAFVLKAVKMTVIIISLSVTLLIRIFQNSSIAVVLLLYVLSA